MSDKITTLKQKNDTTVNIYPNIKSDNIPSNAVTEAKINLAAVSTAKIVDGAVTTAKIEDYAVTENKLYGLSVSTAKIQDSAVTTAKINDGAITNAKLAAASIDEIKMTSQAFYGTHTYNIQFTALLTLTKGGISHQQRILISISVSAMTYNAWIDTPTNITKTILSNLCDYMAADILPVTVIENTSGNEDIRYLNYAYDEDEQDYVLSAYDKATNKYEVSAVGTSPIYMKLV